jgi:hypothetical protein
MVIADPWPDGGGFAALLFVPAQFRPKMLWGAKLAGLRKRWRLRRVY